MIRKLWLILASIAVLGVVGVAPPADASHNAGPKGGKNGGPHENSPAPPVPGTVTNVCTVVGGVEVNDAAGTGGVGPQGNPLDPDKNHNHFRFLDTRIECRDITEGQTKGNEAGVFRVQAAGGTDGMGGTDVSVGPPPTIVSCDADPQKDPKCLVNHGEDLSVGWSHSSCYSEPAPPAMGSCPQPTGKKLIADLYAGTNCNDTVSVPPDCNDYNFGEITAWKSADKHSGTTDVNTPLPASQNWLKFCRGVYDDNGDGEPDCQNVVQAGAPKGGTSASTGGGNVVAWGKLVWDEPVDTKQYDTCFLANLDLAPVKPDGSPPNHKVDRGKLNSFTLVGDAVLWQATPEKADGGASCDDGKKNKTS